MTYAVKHADATLSLQQKYSRGDVLSSLVRAERTGRPWRARWLLAFACVCGTASAAEQLPALRADAQQTSVSGISSGAYMAVQFHVAYSALVKGAGVVAGGPFYCAQNNTKMAAKNCMLPDESDPLPAVEGLIAFTDKTEKAGAIDATANLKNSRVWLFSGRQDKLVKQPVMNALQRYYANYVPPTNIVYEHTIEAGHTFPTVNYGRECPYTGPPFINDCDIDAAGLLLRHIYGSLNARAAQQSGTLREFDQREFFGGDAYSYSMRDTGFVYIPRSCEQTSCRVHVAFHGCMQNAGTVGDKFVRHAGYNEWAETNNLIVVYPQTITRYGVGWKLWKLNFVFNPAGCWDWWGYTNDDYYQKNGPQMRGVKRMIDRLAAQ